METLLAHTNKEIPSLRDCREDIPRELDLAFQKMVAKERVDRFESMDEIEAELSQFIAHDVPASRPTGDASTISSGLSKSDSSSGQRVLPACIGFHLETANSYVSWIGDDGVPVPILNDTGRTATPTVVKLLADRLAVEPTELDHRHEAVEHVASEFLGNMGNRDLNYTFRDKEFPAEILTAVVLKHLAASVRQQTGALKQACHAFPNCYSDSRQDALQVRLYRWRESKF